MAVPALQSWLDALPPDRRTQVDALRAIVSAAAPDLIEEIKWNAPSFRDADDHKVTLGMDRKGGVRIVLHRGTRKQEAIDLRGLDRDRIADWPAPDRCVVSLPDLDAIRLRKGALARLIARWIAATG